jgi:putative ATPase
VNDAERGYGKWTVVFEDGALEHLVETANGDARSLLNAIELAVETSPEKWPPQDGSTVIVTLGAAEESIQKRAVLYDRDGDYHFDTISAFIKSVRGSDPDAALYWLAKMVRAGEDPAFIFRRMIILASEDVGLADPNALNIVLSCANAFDRIGFPEGNYPLAHACLYLATAPKSNSTMAFFDALAVVDSEDAEVPNHLKDANRDKEGFGHGEGYIYPHAYREHWRAQQYLPSNLQGKMFYIPSKIGYEKSIHDDVMRKRELQAASVLTGGGISAATLLNEQTMIFNAAAVQSGGNLLVLNSGGGLLLWEAMRRTQEGFCACLAENEDTKKNLEMFSRTLMPDEIKMPKIIVCKTEDISPEILENGNVKIKLFDHIIAREPLRSISKNMLNEDFLSGFASKIRSVLAGSLVFTYSAPEYGERISRIVKEECNAADKICLPLEKACSAFWKESITNSVSEKVLQTSFSKAGFTVEMAVFDQTEERVISEQEIELWFNTEKSKWGNYIYCALGREIFYDAKSILQERAKQGPVNRKWKTILVKAFC